MPTTKRTKIKNTRVQFSAADHQLVKAAAKKQMISFNQFVSGLAVAIARRVLQASDDSVIERLAAQVFPDNAGGNSQPNGRQ